MIPAITALLPAMGFWDFISSIFQTLIAMALFFGVVAVVLSYLRYQVMTREAARLAEENLKSEDAFQMSVAQYLGSIHKTPPPFGVVMVSLHDPAGLEEKYGPELAGEMQEFAVEQVRKSLRKSDVMIRQEEGRIGLIIPVEREKLWGIATRLVVELPRLMFKGPDRLAVPLPLGFGAATFPENGDQTQRLIEQASQALAVALEKGPSTVQFAAEPQKAEAEESSEAEDDDTPGQMHLLDPLTGVLKPSRVGSTMQKYVARFRRDELPVSLIYLDIDGLDQYNRHYGRKGGDAILKELGKLLSDEVREQDIIGRVEGEEFVISMACGADDAFKAAQRLANLIKKTPFSLGSSSLRITVCIGVAGHPEHGVTARQLFHGAQQALRTAKKRGRNTVIQYHADMTEETGRHRMMDTF